MKRRLMFVALTGLLLLAVTAPLQAATGPVLRLEIRGVINPLTTRYLARGLEIARQEDAELVVIELDTPGGLETAMREMVQLLLQSSVPTVVYVTPGGARATSAGLFVLLAADVAAMAPATHVGAAHPVPLGEEISDVMDAKVTSDAAALVRSIATKRGRNADWAERAVRENLSVTAEEALELNVIDVVAADLSDLLRQLDGRTVDDVTLETGGKLVDDEPMNIGERFYHVITEPNLAYLLLSVGTLLLLTELADPGLSIAGIGAVVAYLIAFLGLGNLPVNWVGVALLAVSAVLFVVALLTDTEAIVSVVALVPFVLGSLLLFVPFRPISPALPTVRVSPWLIAFVGLIIIGFSLLVLRAILLAIRRPPQSGAQRLIGWEGLALTDLTPTGQVRVDRQEWSAIAIGDDPIPAGSAVRVRDITGVRLLVEAAEPVAKDTNLQERDAPTNT
ncbi:MAG: NfeD family protein [Anaerolineae bacterium]